MSSLNSLPLASGARLGSKPGWDSALWAGGVMAMVFLVPALTLVLALPLLAGVLLSRRGAGVWLGAPPLVWAVVAVIALHLIGLILGQTPYQRAILLEIGVVVAILALFMTSRDGPVGSGRFVDGFFAVLVPLIALISIVALVKAALLERGVLLSFVPGPIELYPGGSSLRSDYNVFGLSLLAGALGLLRMLSERARWKGSLALPTIALALVLAALSMTGSRRTLILATMIPAYWAILALFVERGKGITVRTGLALLAATLGAAWLFAAVTATDKAKTYVVWPAPASRLAKQAERPVASLPMPGVPGTGDLETGGGGLAPPMSAPGQRIDPAVAEAMEAQGRETDLALLQSMGRENAYGFATRTGRWQYGWQRISEQGWWKPAGFSYHREFSCRFVKCEHIDYPHLPLLSEWMIGGGAGLAAALACLLFALWAAWQAGWNGWRSGATPVLLVSLPSVLISGDTLLSTPQFLVAALLVYCSLARPARSAAGPSTILA